MVESRSSCCLEISRLLTGRIIWPIFPSPVNLTDFPQEQQVVPNALRSKALSSQVNSPRHVVTNGGQSGSSLVSACRGQSLVIFRTIQFFPYQQTFLFSVSCGEISLISFHFTVKCRCLCIKWRDFARSFPVSLML